MEPEFNIVPPPADAAKMMGSVATDFWRCYGCRRLTSQPEMDTILSGTIAACCPRCGSSRFQPSNPPWYWWAMPRLWMFTIDRLRGRA
jgi:hypothetical protein